VRERFQDRSFDVLANCLFCLNRSAFRDLDSYYRQTLFSFSVSGLKSGRTLRIWFGLREFVRATNRLHSRRQRIMYDVRHILE